VTVSLTVPDLAGLHRRRSAKWSSVADDVLSLTVAEMDFPVAAPIAESLRRAIDRDDLGYAPSENRPLLDAFIGFAKRRLDWSVDPEQVWVLPDVVEGLLALCGLLDSGDEVCVPVPSYPPFLTTLPRAGVRVRQIAMLQDGSLDLEQLRVAFSEGARALILASPYNPTGRVFARAELAAIAELCGSYDAYVFSDEIHAPLVLGETPHTCWLEVSDAARDCGVVLTSASKTFNLAGLKAAMLVTAGGRGQQLAARLTNAHAHAGLFGVISAEAAFADGDEWLDAVLAQLRLNSAQLADELARALPTVGFEPPQATYLAWLDCTKLGLGDDPAKGFVDHGSVALSSGPSFGAPGDGFARLNFATSPEHLSEAIRRMATAAGAAAAANA
jgi:cysteine-S-conjugate beta-lyase